MRAASILLASGFLLFLPRNAGVAEVPGMPLEGGALCFPGEQWRLRIQALGVTGAYAHVAVLGGCRPGETPRVVGDVETTRWISWVWRVRDSIQSHMDAGLGRTLSTHMEEDENGSQRARTDTYLPGHVVTSWERGEGAPRRVDHAVEAGTRDPFTVLLQLRGLPLRDGEVLLVPIFSKDTVHDGRIVVKGRETMEVLGKQTRVIHLRANFLRGTKVSSVFADIWLTDDARRLPAQVDAGTSYGHLRSELLEAVLPAP